MLALIHDLSELIDGVVAWDDATLESHSRDTSLFYVRPSVVVFPQHEADVCALVRYVRNARLRGEHLSLTARAGGTCMTGGPLTTSIVIDFSKYFKKIEWSGTNDAELSAEPGVFYKDFETESLRRNLLLPSFPASREICMIGGMVANNAGGEKTLRYGKTENYVRALRVVFADGVAHDVIPLNASQLHAKQQQKDFEGEIYRTIIPLIKNHEKFFARSHPHVTKNSAGYALWNIWNSTTQTFDLTKLFVGSQGTLGLITRATFSLITPKKYSRSVIIFLENEQPLGKIIPALLAHNPETLESFDKHTFKIALKLFPQLVARMNKNIFSAAVHFLPELWMLLTSGIPQYFLIAEFTGDTAQDALAHAQHASQTISFMGFKTHVTRSEIEAQKYWVMRRESFNLLRQQSCRMRAAPFIDDVIVPPSALTEFLPALYKILNASGMLYTVAGHMGDGNFHIIPLVNPKIPALADNIEKLIVEVYDLVQKHGGSFTAEHNDGIIRTPFLKKLYGSEMYDLFQRTKNIFDPLGIFNPGKKVGGTWEFARRHFDF